MSSYIPTIGLETHAELSTNSKVFCTCSAEFGGTPNSQMLPRVQRTSRNTPRAEQEGC